MSSKNAWLIDYYEIWRYVRRRYPYLVPYLVPSYDGNKYDTVSDKQTILHILLTLFRSAWQLPYDHRSAANKVLSKSYETGEATDNMCRFPQTSATLISARGGKILLIINRLRTESLNNPKRCACMVITVTI